jgi:DNA-binding NtrC family response regulator
MYEILVVEEQPNLRLLITLELQEEGYRVLPAADLREATHVLCSVTPDAVVLDVDRRDDAGDRLMRRVRDLVPGTPVVVHTGHLSAASPVLREEAAAVVIKTSNLCHLTEAVREAVDRQPVC